MILLDLRPSEIVRMFWDETIVIEEDAIFFDPEYFIKEGV